MKPYRWTTEYLAASEAKAGNGWRALKHRYRKAAVWLLIHWRKELLCTDFCILYYKLMFVRLLTWQASLFVTFLSLYECLFNCCWTLLTHFWSYMIVPSNNIYITDSVHLKSDKPSPRTAIVTLSYTSAMFTLSNPKLSHLLHERAKDLLVNHTRGIVSKRTF